MGFERCPNLLIQKMYAENISYIPKVDVPRPPMHISQKFGHFNGAHFLRRVAVEQHNEITCYEIEIDREGDGNKNWNKEFSLKIHTDKEKIADLPDHVLLRTNNIDYLREVFDSGRKVSWYDVDINFFTPVLAMFNFEHVFIDIMRCEGVILPSGKVIPNKDEYGKFFIDCRKPTNKVKFGKLIGYWPTAIIQRTDRFGYVRGLLRYFRRQGKDPKEAKMDSRYLYPYDLRFYYNMLSITYMLWKKSTVANATKTDAPHV
jgi:hypothetical protein